MAIVFPRGVAIRTTQVIGSFVILNATIEKLKGKDPTEFIKKSGMMWGQPTTRAVAV